MKKLQLILFFAAGALFVSCEKEEAGTAEVAVEQQSLLGTWDVTGYEIEEGTSTTETSGQKLTQNYTSYGKDYDMTVVFNDDPKTVVSDGSYTIVITYTLLGQEYTQEAPAYSALESSSWEVDGSEIIMTNDGKETRAILTEASDNKLVLEMDYNEVVEADASSKITTTGKLTVTLER